jgi:hypothetical protein
VTVSKERVRLLVDALKSGEYAKTCGKLHVVSSEDDDRPEGWCCLGVAGDVAAKNGLDVPRETRDYGVIHVESIDGNISYMGENVREWYGFDDRDPRLLTPTGTLRCASQLNDQGYWDGDRQVEFTLPEIGDLFANTFLQEEK